MIIFLLSVISIPTTAILLLQNNRIQNIVAQKLTDQLSSFFETKVNIGHVSLDVLNRLHVQNFYMADKMADTLLFSQHLTLDIGSVSLGEKSIRINKLELSDATINLSVDTAHNLNLAFIVNKLKGNAADSLKPGWHITFDNIGIFDATFRFKRFDSVAKDTGINFSDICLTELHVRLKNLYTNNGKISFKINRLSGKEKSGFRLNNLSAQVAIQHNQLYFDDVSIFTPRTDIEAPRLHFDFNNFADFADVVQKVRLHFELDESHFSLSDVAYFANSLWGMGDMVKLSGNIKGNIGDLKLRQIKLNIGRATMFSGNMSLTGLPNIKETYMYIDTKDLILLANDIEALYIPNMYQHKILIPDIVKQAGYIGFKGSFTGFINDFVAYGTFRSKLGTFKTDLMLKPQAKNRIAFNGNLSAVQFAAGSLLGQEALIGKADIQLTANGYIEANNTITGTFDGKIGRLELNAYTYNEIDVKGSLDNNVFDGSIALSDPNVKLYAFGHFNFSKSKPEFNFSSVVDNANLQALHIAGNDSIVNASCQLLANFSGIGMDKIDGEINIANIMLQRNDKTLALQNIAVHAHNNQHVRQLELLSDVVDVDINGNFDLSSLPASVATSIKHYLPSGFPKLHVADQSANGFTYKVHFKNTEPVFDFFKPGISIAPNTYAKGTYFPEKRMISCNIVSDFFRKGNMRFDTLNFNVVGNPDSLVAVFHATQLHTGDRLHFTDVNILSTAASNTCNAALSWLDTMHHKSNLRLNGNFLTDTSGSSPFQLVVQPDNFYFLDSLWTVQKSVVVFDSSAIEVQQLQLLQGSRHIRAFGKVSANPTDILNVDFNDFNLNILNTLTQSNKLFFEGFVSGNIDVSDFYNNRLMNANIVSAKLSLNGEVLGKTKISLKWNNDQQKILVHVNAQKDDLRTLNIKGSIAPASGLLNLNVDVDKLGIIVFQPFIQSVFTLMKGSLTGNLTVNGTTQKPSLNGSLNVSDTRFVLNLFKTSYKFDTKIVIEDNKFVLNNLKLYDRDKNVCIVNGFVENNYFRDFFINLNLSLDKTMVINTFPSDNWPFYGKGYASGNVRLTGQPGNLMVDITHARTEKNTVISIPLNRQGDLAENDFITFVNNRKAAAVKHVNFNAANYEVKQSGVVLNLDLEVTPDAEIQLVFDPKVGDIMKSQGAGNLKIAINNSGSFSINGDYTVQGGEYLFTLQNIINKKFLLEQGGTIVFNGNPLDAVLDMKAQYNTKAPLINILAEAKEEYKKRIPIDCRLFITGKLLSPDIRYDIDLPNAADETKNRLRDAINNEEELSKQFLSLLVLNNFIMSNKTNASLNGRDIVSNTSMELLSNQISNWISQVSKDVDIGISYHPGDQVITSQEMEVALSTQIFDDRVSINGNLDMIGNNPNTKTNTKNIVGDVNVEVKITDKLKFKAFNRSNDQLYYDELYTQGIGIVYREEFGSLAELRHRYFTSIFKPAIPDSTITKVPIRQSGKSQ